MPYMTGLMLSKEIRELRPDIPIILCSGYTNDVVKETIQKLGIDAFIDKPYQQDELSQIVRNVLDENFVNK